MFLSSHVRIIAAALAASAILAASVEAATKCPKSVHGLRVLPEGAILMRTELAVNPDGTAASYVPGDHGYTYVANGVNLIDKGKKRNCLDNFSLCRKKWKEAETADFAPGSPEFCVFALEAVPYKVGVPLSSCEGDRYVVGNGKGRPMMGPKMPAFDGTDVSTYLSTTSMKHTVDKKAVYVDSAAIPGLVVPRGRSSLLGSLAWVRYGDREVFAIVNDTGPSFGEGSVALHQLLRYGAIQPFQPIGPIPLNLRCAKAERDLKAPFLSKPNDGEDDLCKSGYDAASASDIRAYHGIGGDVVTIILDGVTPPMTSKRLVGEELTLEKLSQWVLKAGYTSDKLNEMANCLEMKK
ncbi:MULTISPECIES: hypothetical protein [Sinorhizobium]|uniref:Uncharacterized protein n=1 Tax=Sinorhizobium americanum TaxID=194963 RepID=A0A2S3YNA0_9HYPH|nr:MULTISPECIES: hypothetical protein [Sinorhizobium]PDT33189.1 hypothetical protein CO656_28805 [Sinorhizobium sp. FG01]POH30565.1 hypothetical protein ATY31_14720 [Sinorhizobium americanum]